MESKAILLDSPIKKDSLHRMDKKVRNDIFGGVFRKIKRSLGFGPRIITLKGFFNPRTLETHQAYLKKLRYLKSPKFRRDTIKDLIKRGYTKESIRDWERRGYYKELQRNAIKKLKEARETRKKFA